MIKNLEEYTLSLNREICKLLYTHAITLLEEFDDEDLVELLLKYPLLFLAVMNKDMAQLLTNADALLTIINILVNELNSRHLTKDEFDSMTLDDVKDYIASLIKEKNVSLYDLIKELEG